MSGKHYYYCEKKKKPVQDKNIQPDWCPNAQPVSKSREEELEEALTEAIWLLDCYTVRDTSDLQAVLDGEGEARG
jgi:hypothetical protein